MPQRRKPNRLRALQGQSERTTPVYPELDAEDVPDWMPAEARAEWDRVVPLVMRAHPGHLQAVDRAALVGYVMAWHSWAVAARDVA